MTKIEIFTTITDLSPCAANTINSSVIFVVTVNLVTGVHSNMELQNRLNVYPSDGLSGLRDENSIFKVHK